jgi:hypothetical protein
MVIRGRTRNFLMNSERGNREIGQKPISNPKLEITNWTSNSKFRISDLKWAFVQFQIVPISQQLDDTNI